MKESRLDRDRQDPLRSLLSPRVVLGVAIIYWGVAHLLEDLGILRDELLLQFMPLALVLFGVSLLVNGASVLLSWLLIVGGTLELAHELGLIDVTLWDLWPVGLIIAGIVIFRQSTRSEEEQERGVVAPESGFEEVVILCDRRIRPASFREGALTSFMGSATIDLTETRLEERGSINVFCMWGSVTLVLPKDCSAVPRVLPVWAGLEDKTWSSVRPTRQVDIKGMVLMGGIEIRNGHAREKEAFDDQT